MSSTVLELQRGGPSSYMTNAMGIFPATTSSTDYSWEKEKPTLRLREPRDLYSTTSLQHPPKWPIECQVLPESKPHHIMETAAPPAKFENFYIPTNSEPLPKPVGDEMGTVVYEYDPKLSVDYFCRSCVGGSEAVDAVNTDLEPNTLKFESRFESGNLAKAVKITSAYYELHLRQDLYTDRHSQWYYFRVQGMRDDAVYRLSIVNFNKPDSLYRYGLKVLMYSEKEAQISKTGWTRCGQNIAYYKNDITSDESLYTLTFNIKFKHANDTVYFAHCYPYTYSQLQNYLRLLEDDTSKSDLLTVRLLCRSLAGNNVYVLTVTSPPDNCDYTEDDSQQKKPAVVLSARVHPGETQSSYMMKGIIDFLTSDCPQAKDLRDRFIWKLIPMLNPDGVIVGNSRCCLLGQDLNRQYRTVLREAFPQIYQVKGLLRRLEETHGVFMYCDIHGHSRKNNVFMYGCENRKFPEKKLIEQVFPLMMHKNAADKFSFQNCKFRVQKNKEGTGRVFAWTLGIVNSYTLEISLCGSTMPSRPGTHFNTADYEALGRHFCESMLDFSDPSPEKEKLRDKILQRLISEGSNADEPANIVVTDYSSLSHSETEDGDSETDTKANKKDLPSQPPSNPLKRQASLRAFKKRSKPEVAKLRSTLIVKSTSAVTSIRTAAMTGTLNNNIISSRPTPNQEPEDTSKKIAVFKRLTKFRRIVRKEEELVAMTDTITKEINYGPKCTSILFDDPFNPPGGQMRRRSSSSPEEEDDEPGSGTEDECNEKDGALKTTNPHLLMIGDFQRMEISDKMPFPSKFRGNPAKESLLLTRKKKSLDEVSSTYKTQGATTIRRASLATVSSQKNVGIGRSNGPIYSTPNIRISTGFSTTSNKELEKVKAIKSHKVFNTIVSSKKTKSIAKVKNSRITN